jgi:hypothetical protein
MKATYQKPEILTENVQAQQTLLAGSLALQGTADKNSTVLSKDNYGDEDYWED